MAAMETPPGPPTGYRNAGKADDPLVFVRATSTDGVEYGPLIIGPNLLLRMSEPVLPAALPGLDAIWRSGEPASVREERLDAFLRPSRQLTVVRLENARMQLLGSTLQVTEPTRTLEITVSTNEAARLERFLAARASGAAFEDPGPLGNANRPSAVGALLRKWGSVAIAVPLVALSAYGVYRFNRWQAKFAPPRAITEAELASARATIESARARLEALDAARRAAMASAPATLVPRPDLGRCSSTVQMPGLLALANDPHVSNTIDFWDRMLRESGSVSVEHANLPARPEAQAGPRAQAFREKAQLVTSELENARHPYSGSQTPEEILGEVRTLLPPGGPEDDATLVVDREVVPRATEGESFQSGALAGTLYVWSYHEGRIVCAARVLATNSDSVRVSVRTGPSTFAGPADLQANVQLQMDLEMEGFRTGFAALVAAGPRVAPAGQGEEREPEGL